METHERGDAEGESLCMLTMPPSWIAGTCVPAAASASSTGVCKATISGAFVGMNTGTPAEASPPTNEASCGTDDGAVPARSGSGQVTAGAWLALGDAHVDVDALLGGALLGGE